MCVPEPSKCHQKCIGSEQEPENKKGGLKNIAEVSWLSAI